MRLLEASFVGVAVVAWLLTEPVKVSSMPKRRREEEETLETGNVDQGDFSDGDSDEEENDDANEKTDKYDVMREDDIEGIFN